MANAVQDAAIVIICMSEKYKNSASCRSEAEYAFKLEKPIIPVRMEPDYEARGWLGLLAGTKLYFNCWTTDLIHNAIPGLLKELDGYLHLKPTVFIRK